VVSYSIKVMIYFCKRRYQSVAISSRGIYVGEKPIQAMYRELSEETGWNKKIPSLLRNLSIGISIKYQKKILEKLKMGSKL